jgi:acetylornithine deacetylase
MPSTRGIISPVVPDASVTDSITAAVDAQRLVDFAEAAISVPSFTGDEQAMAELMAETLTEMGMAVQWQQVEDGRANVLGTLAGSGGGKTLMFNGHMDTSYSGREPWLRHVPGFQPHGFVEDGRLYGLGVSNMKGALACYVEAVRALQDAGVALAGDVMIAAVCGEIEKTQQGDAQGAQYRGYAAGSRYLVSHGGVADMCILGEPTEGKVVLGHFGSLWLRISTHGNFIHTAFTEGKRDRNSILRMREVLDAVLEWVPTWEGDPENAYRGAGAIVNVGAVQGGFGWRVSRTPHRTDLFLDVRVPPTKEMAVARRQVLEMVRGLADRFPDYGVEGEVYVTAPGAEIEEGHPLVAAIDAGHAAVFGAAPERDVTRWFSDASALTRYGVPTVNYGTSTGLLDTEKGENLDIDGLVKTAQVYALAAADLCGATA